jgi:hypothetical protein
MADPIIEKFESLRRSLEEKLDREKAKLQKLQAKVEESQKLVGDLQKTLINTLREIDRLNGTPKKASAYRSAERRTPYEWGDGSRIAFALLREEVQPVSVPDLAKKALALRGIHDPPDDQFRAMTRVIYAAFREQVAKGRIKQHDTKPRTYSTVSSSSIPLAVTRGSMSEVA